MVIESEGGKDEYAADPRRGGLIMEDLEASVRTSKGGGNPLGG